MNERLQQLRKILKKTQSEFGSICGKSRTAIAKYETDKSTPDDAFIKLVCMKFNVNEHWLRTGEGDMFIKTDEDMFKDFAQKYNLSPSEQRIAKYCLSLTSEQRQTILKHVLAIAKLIDENEDINITHRPDIPDHKLTTDEKRNIVNSQLDAEEKEQTS